MFSQDRNQLRQMFFHAWQKHRDGKATEPLETLINQIILMHPEYHGLLDNPEANLDRDYLPEEGETNPFLHMSMHIAIHEQRGTGRPAGIEQFYQALSRKLADPHEAEHQMMECLAEMIWQSQRNNSLPDEQAYLDCLSKKTDS